MFTELCRVLETQFPDRSCAWRIENIIASGTPDVCMTVAGLTYWVELKYGHTKVRPAQVARIEQWSRGGGLACVLRYIPRLSSGVYRLHLYTDDADDPEIFEGTLTKVLVDLVEDY